MGEECSESGATTPMDESNGGVCAENSDTNLEELQKNSELADAKELFEYLDVNKSGTLSRDEIRKLTFYKGEKKMDSDAIFDSLTEESGNEEITLEEFQKNTEFFKSIQLPEAFQRQKMLRQKKTVSTRTKKTQRKAVAKLRQLSGEEIDMKEAIRRDVMDKILRDKIKNIDKSMLKESELDQIVLEKPHDYKSLRATKGVGKGKAWRYGWQILMHTTHGAIMMQWTEETWVAMAKEILDRANNYPNDTYRQACCDEMRECRGQIKEELDLAHNGIVIGDNGFHNVLQIFPKNKKEFAACEGVTAQNVEYCCTKFLRIMRRYRDHVTPITPKNQNSKQKSKTCRKRKTEAYTVSVKRSRKN